MVHIALNYFVDNVTSSHRRFTVLVLDYHKQTTYIAYHTSFVQRVYQHQHYKYPTVP